MTAPLISVGINKYRLTKSQAMKAEVIIYAKESLLNNILNDLSLIQLSEAASLPNIISPVIGMPDIHQGFGLPIGGILATKGLISVGAVGMDINCGVRLLTSNLIYNDKDFSLPRLHALVNQIERLIPIGLGGKHKIKMSIDLVRLCQQGVPYLVKQGFAYKEDLEHIEEGGYLPGANDRALSDKAKDRATKQVGTLGSGNHFIDIQKIDAILDPEIGKLWGLFKDQICIVIHSGSRALGHQTCLDYTDLFWKLRDRYGLQIPHPGLAALPIDCPEGSRYYSAMAAAVNFAFGNRSMISYFVRQVFKKIYQTNLRLLYDVAHNIAKWEIHGGKRLLIHRKGATRALPAGHPQNPKEYLTTGHPAIVPGSMGTASYIMVGLPKNEETFYSINHGAGRLMSRHQAKKSIKEEDFKQIMGTIVHNRPFYLIADEAPQAYKNIEEVINVLVEAGLTKKIAMLKPLAVINGV